MEIIHKFGTVKKKHTYLYNNFDDTMKEEFRKLKGRFYKKTNHWVFPFVKEENVKLNDNFPTQESVSDEIVQVSEENQEIVSVGIQTDEENSIVSTKPISDADTDANADESTVETKSSGVSEENQEIVSVGIQTDEENSIVSTKPISDADTDANADESTVETKSSGVSESYDSDHVIMDNFSDHLSSVIETNSSSSEDETLQMEKNRNTTKVEYTYKPPTIFYHQVANYF